MEAWTQFFVRAGIPKEIAGKYAKAFCKNRITKEMLPDLDKATLTELGVTAIGDQLGILRRIKAAKSALDLSMDSEEVDSEEQLCAKPKKARITAPEGNNSSYSSMSASELRRGKPPPDRNEIYHVKMPEGNTHRTRKIMEKADQMRERGLAVRGTTGVRQGGRAVSPIDKTSLAARMIKKQISEVSSSTDRGDRRHHGTKIARISTSAIKKTISNRPTLSSRLTGSSDSRDIRIQMPKSRFEGRLQKASSSEVVLKYDDEDEELMEEEYEEDRVVYEQELEEDVDDVEEEMVTVPRQRITYGTSSSRVASTVHRTPIRAPSRTHHDHHHRDHRRSSDNSSVFNRVKRVAYNGRR